MTVSEFIQALGGTTEAAGMFSVRPSAVSNWRAHNRLPARIHLRASRIAEARGLQFDPEAVTDREEAAA